MNLGTTSGWYNFPFEERFKILGCAMNRQGKSNDAIEERMQTADQAFRKDMLICKRKDVSWKIKCQRQVDHVYVVFAFGSEKLFVERTDVGEDQRMGNQDSVTRVPFQTTPKRNMGHLPIQERVTWPGRDGYRCACLSCMKELQKVCGEPWDGLVTKNSNAVSLKVEKDEMVALHTNRHDGTGSRKSYEMEP